MPVAGLDELALSFAVKYGEQGYMDLVKEGITPDHFDTDYRMAWGFVMRMHRDHGEVPSADMMQTRYADLDIVQVKKRDFKFIIRELKLRYKYRTFLLTATDMASRLGNGWDNIDDVISDTVGVYNTLLNDSGDKKRLVGLFDDDTCERILGEMREIHENRRGIPTGLPLLDKQLGGWQPSRMVVTIGRTGQGKSWINLLHVAHAVNAGYKVALFSLEMTLFEVAMRLYTIFSAILTPKDVLSNEMLGLGLVTEAKLRKFMRMLKERYEGRLYIGDVGQHHGSYTLERIGAEVEAIRPDMFWVDYLTLLKLGRGRAEGWEGVRELSQGIKTIATKLECVGGCSAQVNRAAMSKDANAFMPRLENISFGDSIGHDANHVVSLRKTNKALYWSLIKNRHGREIPRQKLEFKPDEGLMQEAAAE